MVNVQTTHTIAIPNGYVGIDIETAAITTIHLNEPNTEFVTQPSGTGLLRIAAPLEHYPSHYLESGTHGTPEISQLDDGLQLKYAGLASDEGSFPIQVEITLKPSDDGLVLSARVHNGWSEPLSQIIFPQLLDLDAVAGEDDTRLQMGRGCAYPFRELAMEPDDAWWLDRRLQQYLPFGGEKLNMKWFDYGDAQRGLTVYSRNTRHTVQGVLMQRPDRAEERMHLRWMHFPFVQPGETWESGEYVVMPHAGDWYAGAKAYQRFAAQAYPYNAPQRIREALAVRSVWPAVRNAPPTFPISQLPEYAEELTDPELGITELILWHWWLKNGYPIFLDPRLGTEDEFRTAIQQCTDMGVPVVFFVSHHLVRDTDETDPKWLHLNAAMQPVEDNWTYGRDFLPLFQVPFIGTHAMLAGSALSRGWREEGWRNYQEILDRGAAGICFDVFGARKDPNFNPAIDGRPDEEGEKLLEFAERAREMIHAVNPDGTFSGEHIADVNVPVLDYTWEWKNGYQLADAGPFRYVFPHYRLNANVNDHPRSAIVGFMEGALLNVIPGNMRSFLLRDCPELTAMLRKLTPLRRRFLRYFTEGQYRFMEGLTVHGGRARLYTHDDAVLVIAINPTDTAADVTISVDPALWGATPETGTVTEIDLDGHEVNRKAVESSAFQRTMRLDADTLRILEFVPDDQGSSG
jgi:hypothetical protein